MSSAAGHVVLLAQPHDDTREMYAEFLRHNGFTPIAVSNGTDALKAAPRADLIVTGIRLSGGDDGLDVIARLRADERTKNRPIIVLTACVAPADRKRAETAGCDLFLPKPCLPGDLLREVRRMLPRRVRRRRGTI